MVALHAAALAESDVWALSLSDGSGSGCGGRMENAECALRRRRRVCLCYRLCVCVCARKGVSGWVDVCKVRVMICFMPAEVVCVCV